jgi:hypothetical protein
VTKIETCGLELLLQRLAWPSGLVRERASVSLGSLMADEQLGVDTVNAVLAWTAMQKLESIAVLAARGFSQWMPRSIKTCDV